MCKSVNNSSSCGLCAKLKNLLKIHYKQHHSKFTLDILINFKQTRKINEPSDDNARYGYTHIKSQKQTARSLYRLPGNPSTTELQSGLPSFELQAQYSRQPIKSETLSDISDTQNECLNDIQNFSDDTIRDDTPWKTDVTVSSAPKLDDKNTLSHKKRRKTTTNKQHDFQRDSIVFTCPCGKAFATSRELKFHHKVHDMKLDPAEFPHVCLTCDSRYKNKAHYREHRYSHGVFECFCGQLFASKKELLSHKAGHRRKRKYFTLEESANDQTRTDSTLNDLISQSVDSVSQFDDPLSSRQNSSTVAHELSSRGGVVASAANSAMTILDSTSTDERVMSDMTSVKREALSKDDVIVPDFNTSDDVTMGNKKQPLFSCECGKEFALQIELKCHRRVHSESKDPELYPYQCDVCDVRYKQEPVLRQHKIIHGIYACYCGALFSNAQDLANHKPCYWSTDKTPTKVSASRPFQCKICTRTFRRKSQMEQHERAHSKNNLFRCDFCQKSFATEKIFHVHLNSDKHKTNERVAKMPRPAAIAMRHKGLKEKAGDIFTCDICSKSFSSQSALSSHSEKHSGTSRPRNESHLCEECGLNFDCIRKLQKHRSKHNKKFACTHCEFKTSGKYQLVEHIRTHTGEKPLQCEYCAMSFASQANLGSHIKIHIGTKSYMCDRCDFKTVHRGYLKQHLNYVHKDIRNFPCTVCSKRFHSGSILRQHMKRHAGVKCIPCPVCDKKFVDNVDLKSHLRSHSEDRPYKCTFCNDAFKRSEHLKNHTKRHHRERIELAEKSNVTLQSDSILRTDLTLRAGYTMAKGSTLQAHSMQQMAPALPSAYNLPADCTLAAPCNLPADYARQTIFKL